MQVTERLLKYISVDTTSDPHSDTFPSTKSQLDFAASLAKEMKTMGLKDVSMDSYGYVFGTIPSTIENYQGKILGFIAHMDTSSQASGKNIHPKIIENYDGSSIILNKEHQVIMNPEEFSSLKQYVGQDLIVTDGCTLLGADDKAGIAEILTAAEYLLAHPEIKHGPVRIGFTPDEEIGRGTDYFHIENFGADFAYTMDGSDCGELQYENFNAATAFLTFNGVSIHPGSAKNKMVNASLLAVEYQNLMPLGERPEYTEGREGFILLESITGSIEQASCEYIIRDHDMQLFEDKKKCMEQAAAYINTKYGERTVELRIEDSYYNMKEKIEPHMHLVENAVTVYNKLDIKPLIVPIRGGTDGARLSFDGLPCPNLGTGGHNYHGRYEYVCIQSMEKCVQVIIELARLYGTF